MKNSINQIMEKQSAEVSSSKWQRLQQQVSRMRERYGDAKQFLETFTPDLQIVAAKEWVRAYTGTAPTLTAVANGYGEPTAVVWLCVQQENINLFAGVKEKLEVKRQKELSKLILTEYPYLKVSELLLFFHRLKCGKYGRFYGAVDALFISSALLQFTEERRKEIRKIEEDTRAREESTRQEPTGICYEEYLRLKQVKTQQEHERREANNL